MLSRSLDHITIHLFLLGGARDLELAAYRGQQLAAVSQL
jgi:hypothetical protein